MVDKGHFHSSWVVLLDGYAGISAGAIYQSGERGGQL